jgi:hypothetical protein
MLQGSTQWHDDFVEAMCSEGIPLGKWDSDSAFAEGRNRFRFPPLPIRKHSLPRDRLEPAPNANLRNTVTEEVTGEGVVAEESVSIGLALPIFISQI